jgi:predicted DsbA family dithiol-disulfide isomerase
MDRLFDAYFSRGGNVSDHAQLTALATAAGMDAERVRAYLASTRARRSWRRSSPRRARWA